MSEITKKIKNLFAICFDLRVACLKLIKPEDDSIMLNSLLDEARDMSLCETEYLLENEISHATCLAILDRYVDFSVRISVVFDSKIKNSIDLNGLFIKFVLEIADCCKGLVAAGPLSDMLSDIIQKTENVLNQQGKIESLLLLSKMNIEKFLASFINHEDLMLFLQVFSIPPSSGFTVEEMEFLAVYLRSYLSCRYAHLVVRGKVNLAFEDYLEHDESDLLVLESYYHVIESFFIRVFQDINDKLVIPNELRDAWASLPIAIQKECMEHENILTSLVQSLLADEQYGPEEYGVISDILELLGDYQDNENARKSIWWAIMDEDPFQAIQEIAKLVDSGELSLNVIRPPSADLFRGNTPSPIKQFERRSVSPSY